MACKVCGRGAAKFCIECRRKFGGKVVRVVRSGSSSPRRRRASSSSAAAPRRRRRKSSSVAPRARKHLSRAAFLRRMRAGKLRKQLQPAAGRK